MAHYALLDNNNKVTQVIVGIDETENPNAEEFYSNIYGVPVKRTSYNTYANSHISSGTPFRKNFASPGFFYNAELDAFIPPKPFPSWLLDTEKGMWYPPVPYPSLEYNEDNVVDNLNATYVEATKITPDSEYRPSSYNHASKIHQQKFLPEILISEKIKQEALTAVESIPAMYVWNESIQNWSKISPPTE
jgi:hypothetical protein